MNFSEGSKIIGLKENSNGNQWAVGCLAAAGISIAGGTDEVQRNIMAKFVLGL